MDRRNLLKFVASLSAGVAVKPFDSLAGLSIPSSTAATSAVTTTEVAAIASRSQLCNMILYRGVDRAVLPLREAFRLLEVSSESEPYMVLTNLASSVSSIMKGDATAALLRRYLGFGVDRGLLENLLAGESDFSRATRIDDSEYDDFIVSVAQEPKTIKALKSVDDSWERLKSTGSSFNQSKDPAVQLVAELRGLICADRWSEVFTHPQLLNILKYQPLMAHSDTSTAAKKIQLERQLCDYGLNLFELEVATAAHGLCSEMQVLVRPFFFAMAQVDNYYLGSRRFDCLPIALAKSLQQLGSILGSIEETNNLLDRRCRAARGMLVQQNQNWGSELLTY